MIQLASISDCLKVWDSASAESLVSKSRFQSEKGAAFHSVAWNHTNQVVAVGGTDSKIHLVRADHGQIMATFLLTQSKLSNVQVRALAFSHNSKHLACSMGSPIQLWDCRKQSIKAIFTGHTQPIVSLAFLPSGDVFAADQSGKVMLWSASNSTVPVHVLDTERLEGRRTLTVMAISPISSLLAAGYSDGGLRVWDSAFAGDHARTPLCTLQPRSDRISALACSAHNDRLVAAVSVDGTLQMLDMGRGAEPVARLDTSEALTAMAYHDDGVHAAVGTADGDIMVYDWRKLIAPVLTVPAHGPNPVHAIAYHVSKNRSASESAGSLSSSMSSMPSKAMPAVAVPAVNGHTSASAAAARPPHAPTADDALPDPRSPAIMTAARPQPSNSQKPSSSVGPSPAAAAPTPVPPSPLPSSSSQATRRHPSSQSSPRVRESAQQSQRGESLFSTAVAPKPAAASSYSARIQTQLEVGGHATPSIAPQPFSMPESAVDMDYEHAKVKAEVDRAFAGHAYGPAAATGTARGGDFDELRQSIRPVTAKDMEDALESLRYDIHMEMQDVIKEQVRQFIIAKVSRHHVHM